MDALSIAAISMRSDMERVAQVGQNLVNVSTPGYKRVVSSQEVQRFAGLHEAQQALLVSRQSTSPSIDVAKGAMTGTGRSTDLAIEGEGFFVLESSDGPVLTRRGDFQVDSAGRLAGSQGFPVLGTNGEIGIASDSWRVDVAGRVFDQDKFVDQLRIVVVEDAADLQFVGPGLFATANKVTAMPDGYRVLQGHLEGSNVNPASEMLKLVELVKHIEANQRVLQYHDEMLGKALGKFAEI